MSRHPFTEDQQEELRNNQYTRRVSEHSISFTDAFWQEFGRRYLAGEDRYEICQSLGYDSKVIGAKRLEHICREIRDSQNMPPKKRKRPPADTKYSEMTEREAIRAMETELTYLRQEVEFLKKISQLDKEKIR